MTLPSYAIEKAHSHTPMGLDEGKRFNPFGVDRELSIEWRTRNSECWKI